MSKFNVNVQTNYADGYLRYGHYEGVVEAETKEDAIKKIKEDITGYLDFILDSYELNDCDVDYDSLKIEQIKEEGNNNE